MRLSKAEKNHLRRLVGYVRCEIGQSPDEMVGTVRSIAPAVGEVSAEGKARLLEAHKKAQDVPQYIRAGLKALEKALARKGDTVDGEVESRTRLSRRAVTVNGDA